MTRYYLTGLELFINHEHKQKFDSEERPVVLDIITTDHLVLHFDPRPSQDCGVALLVNRENPNELKTLSIPQGEPRRILREYCVHTPPTCAVVVAIGSVVWDEGKKKEEGLLSIRVSAESQGLLILPIIRKQMTHNCTCTHVLRKDLLIKGESATTGVVDKEPQDDLHGIQLLQPIPPP